MDFYFCTVDRKDEIEVIRKMKPPRLLVSFFHFQNKGIGWLIDKIGYRPKILLDSGAYSSLTQGREISLADYMDFIKRNGDLVDRYISLDVIGDPDRSLANYYELKRWGLDPVPVFHYGSDKKYLLEYINQGEKFIALGGTVPIRNKSAVALWVKMIAWMYQEAHFHLLGSSSRRILDFCDIESADSSTWILSAANGKPRTIKGRGRKGKLARAQENMRQIIKTYH